MSDRWFRLYESVVNDPKVQRLPGEVFKGLINLWCIASANDGRLPSIADMAFTLRTSEAKVMGLIKMLSEAGLIEADETGFVPHNWNGRQFKSDVSTNRVKQFRERKKSVSRNADETFHETPPETEQKQIQNSEPKGSARLPLPDPERDLFARGKTVLGKEAGGLITKLLKAKNGEIALARAAIEQASVKENPREYIGAIIRGRDPPPDEQRWDPRL